MISGSKGHIVGSTLWDITQNIAPCEEGIWISESVKSGIQGFGAGIQPRDSWIPLTIGIRIQDPLTKAGIGYLESGIQGVESTIQDCLGFPHFGRKKKSRIQNIQSKITAIDLGGQRWHKFKTSFRKISLWLTPYREHFDGILVIAETFGIQNYRLEFYLEDLRKIRHQLWIFHILIP